MEHKQFALIFLFTIRIN